MAIYTDHTSTTDDDRGAVLDRLDTALDPYVPSVVVDWLSSEPSRRVREVDGTLVFADVSGFTPLSERLARKGRVGAEELTEILNRVFGRLLDTAYGLGGDLLKFGGDALLLLFTGDEHASRAAVAAADMQVELRTLGRVDTGSGIVRLRMSVGVHSGPMLLFLVGTSHRELLITGPGATETVRMEGIAAANEVLVSPGAADRISPAWLSAEKEGGRLLRVAKVAGSIAPTAFTRPRSEIALVGVPACLREFLANAPADGEHRQATLSFLQFKGLDELLEREGPDAVATALDELISVAQVASARHDVTFLATDVDADGGKILFSAGAPKAGANDDDRMLQALRDILDAEPRLDIRAGVNRGHAFAVDVGAPYRRTFAVMGDPTNLAARVMGKAPMRSMLATKAVTDRLRGDFELRPLEPFMVKGKSHPIAASEVGHIRAARRADGARHSPFIGRDREQAALRAGVERARLCQGSVLVIVGEPGLGKSRLVEQARQIAHDLAVFSVEGGQYATLTPYFALRAPLRALIGTGVGDDDATVAIALRKRLERDAPELLPWLPLAAIPFGVEVEDSPETAALHPDFRRARLNQVLTSVMARLLGGPALVVVEDAHWLDEASAGFLVSSVEELAELPWFICVTRRDEAGGLELQAGASVDLMPLSPFTADTALELVIASSHDAPLPPDVIAAVVERSAGNPLFLQELLGAARQGRSVDDLPDAVEPLIAARIDTLRPDHRQLLRQAAVLGVRFPLDLLDEMADDDLPVRDSIAELEGFVTVEGGIGRFHHAMLRQVAYETLPFRRRRMLHERAGELIESRIVEGGERPAALLSMHFFEAQRYEAAWRYAREAGDIARNRSAPVEAATLYERAVDAARHLRTIEADELASVYFEWGNAAQRAGRYDVAATAYRAARRLWRDQPLKVARVAAEDGRLQEHKGAYAEALRVYTRGKRVLDDASASDESAEITARLLVAYGAVRLRQGRYLDAIGYEKRAVEIAEGMGTSRAAKEILAHAFYLLDWAYTDLGDPEAGHWRELALPIYEELEDFHGQGGVLNNLGIDAYYEGRWADSIELYERAREAMERSGDAMRMASAINNIGEVLSDQGHLDEAERAFREAWRIWKSLDARAAVACAINNLGRLASRAGRFDEASERFDEAAVEFEACGAKVWLLEVDARRAERAILLGRPDEALGHVERIGSAAARLGAPPVLTALVERVAGYALLQQGDVDAATERLQASLRSARIARSPFEEGLTLLALADAAFLSAGDPAPTRADARALLAGLGVIAVPAVPLPVPR